MSPSSLGSQQHPDYTSFIYLGGLGRTSWAPVCTHQELISERGAVVMNKCRRHPGGPARPEGPLISSSIQSGCLTRHGAEVVMSFPPPSCKHRAHRRAGTPCGSARGRRHGLQPDPHLGVPERCFSSWQTREGEPRHFFPPLKFASFCLCQALISQAGRHTGFLCCLKQRRAVLFQASLRGLTVHAETARCGGKSGLLASSKAGLHLQIAVGLAAKWT